MTYTLAILLTCHNRETETISCLSDLFKSLSSFNSGNGEIHFLSSVFLTDDGCIDRTSEKVLATFPQYDISILKGNGQLFWAGGMRLAWNEALKRKFDFYLLLNDDTNVKMTLFEKLLYTHLYSQQKYKKEGIYVGTTSASNDPLMITYGGNVFTNKFLAKYERLMPSDKPQKCDMANANILMVPSSVVDKIGILHCEFRHGIADFDYTLSANSKNIPVLVAPGICGVCNNEHKNLLINFSKMSLKERRFFLYSPLGFATKDYLVYIRRNFIYRYPFVFFAAWLKLYFPWIYLKMKR